jgi:hypothetical protein
MAYQLDWEGKTVLFTGGIPAKVGAVPEARLLAEVFRSRDATMDYVVSVNKLASITPDLWLPAIPSDCQNANIYDNEWSNVINHNYRLGYRSLLRLE